MGTEICQERQDALELSNGTRPAMSKDQWHRYPFGLAGYNIPFVARLAVICDVYDAMTTIRPYKRAWSQAERAVSSGLRLEWVICRSPKLEVSYCST